MSWLYTLVFAGLIFSSNNVHFTKVTADTPAKAQQARQGDETERFEQTYPLTANGRISLSNVNGSIVINAWDRAEVKLVAVKTADSKERLGDVQIKVDSKPDYLSVETEYGDWKSHNGGWHNNGRLQVDYELTVPRGASLNEIETVNGSVTVGEFTNLTKVSAVNGNIKATNLRGTANLSTVNGEVFADFTRLETGSKVYLETVNGTVNLSIPSDSSATVRADSVNGAISNDFGLPVRKGQYVGRDLYGRLGAGDVQVKLSSVNGRLSIARNKDGKSPSPATNLLQQKNQDNEDWEDNDDDKDSDTSMAAMNAKINKDVAKSMKESQKAVVKAMKETQAIKVEVPKIEIPPIEMPVVKIDSEALKKATEAMNVNVQAQVNAAIRAQGDAMARIRDINFSGMPRIEKRSESIAVKGAPKVTISAPGCSVKVRGWDKQEVQYNVIQFTNSRNRATVQTNENHTDSAVNINVNTDKRPGVPQWSDDNRVQVEVFVPKKSDLKISTDGEIRLDGVSGQIDLSGSEGSIDVRDSDGKMSVSTACGQVRVIGFRGDLDAKTKQGDVYLEGDFNRLTAQAADGTVILTVPSDGNASIVSNTEVESQGVDLVQEKDSTWRLGTGLRKYNFDFDEGHLIVRSNTELSN
jgi:DUF4097 and DUF4098 domain-containing protein YvlB